MAYKVHVCKKAPDWGWQDIKYFQEKTFLADDTFSNIDNVCNDTYRKRST